MIGIPFFFEHGGVPDQGEALRPEDSPGAANVSSQERTLRLPHFLVGP